MELQTTAVLGRLGLSMAPASDRPQPSTYNISRLGLAPLSEMDPLPPLDDYPVVIAELVPDDTPVPITPVLLPAQSDPAPPGAVPCDSPASTAVSAISAVSPSPCPPDRRKTTYRLPTALLDQLRTRAADLHCYQCSLVAQALDSFLHPPANP